MTLSLLVPSSLALLPLAFAGGGPGEPAAPPAATDFLGLLPRAVTSFGAEVSDGWLYVLGGYEGVPHRYSREGQPGDFYRIGTVDARNLELLPPWIRTQGTALTTHGGRLYAVGGMRIENAAGEPEDLRSIPDAAVFDPVARTWTELPPLPAGRSSHDADFVGDVLCVAGGWRLSGDKDGSAWHDTLLMLDVAAGGDWVEVPAPFRRRALATAATADTLVVVGGMEPGREVSSQVLFFDPRARAWSQGPDFPERGFGVAAVGVGERVYASAFDGVLWSLEPGVDGAWRREAGLFAPRFFHQLVAADGDVLVLGGIQGMDVPGRIRLIERLAPGVPGGGDAPVMRLPSEGLAKNRFAAFVQGGRLHLFGGNLTTDQHDFDPDSFTARGVSLNLQTLRWAPAADLPVARQSLSTLVVGDAVGVAAGGFGHDGEVARSHAEVYAYDFEADAWSSRGSLARPRTQFALVEHGDFLWAFGGLDYHPHRAEPFELVLDVERAPVEGGDFVPTGVALPAPRRAFGGAVLDGRMFLVGGMREDFAQVESCHAFDFETRAWTEIARPARPRVSPELVAHGGRLYLCGGLSRDASGELRPDPTVEVYDPGADAWSVLPTRVPEASLRHARFFPAAHGLAFVTAHLPEAGLDLGFVPLAAEDGVSD